MPSVSDILKKAKGKAGQKEKFVKPAAGKTAFRILPGETVEGFYHPYGEHWIKDLAGNVQTVMVCPDATFGKSCEVCDMIKAAIKESPDDETTEKLKEMKAQQLFLMNATKPDEDPNKVVILALGKQAFGQILEAIEEYQADEDGENAFTLLDADRGQDVIINREGSGFNTKYSVTVRPASKSKPVPKSALMQRKNLTEYVDENIEEKKAKALETLGVAMGIAAPSTGAAKALTGPASSKSAAPELDDEIPGFDDEPTPPARKARALEEEIEDAEVMDEEPEAKAAAPAADDFGADMPDSDEDLDALLKDL